MMTELLLLGMVLLLAGKQAAALTTLPFLILFWGGVVFLGLLFPLWFTSRDPKIRIRSGNLVLTSALALTGGALLRICVLQVGQL
jgi:formate-dependent nitrite reductase membrane component NrfD